MKLLQLVSSTLLLLLAYLPLPLLTQYVRAPNYDKVIASPLNANISISYKQRPAGTCTTASATQKQYTGYIHLPAYILAPVQQNYSINTFFGFVEGRQAPETAPLTIWLSGGPGTSSLFGFFNEVGPCRVVRADSGTYGTQVNDWGWDRSSNMLFIDQPNQVGFSFDRKVNGSYNLYNGAICDPPMTCARSLPEYMYLNVSTRHFLQAWLLAFPQYSPALQPNVTPLSGIPSASLGINLFTESYGGKYGPVFATYFEQQNEALQLGSLQSNSTLNIWLQTVGIVNGKIDNLVQDYYYPLFAYNNTYGIQAISQVEELNEISEFDSNCVAQIQQCRTAIAALDPGDYGDVDSVNDLCAQAQVTCDGIMNPYLIEGYYPFDIRQKDPSPDPPAAYQEYLNHQSVLSAIGAQVNFTESSRYVLNGFRATGDTIRGDTISDLANLLNIGVKVALIYGDADYICNWYGGQAVSLAIASLLQNCSGLGGGTPCSSSALPYASGFSLAGYADIVVNNTYVGGMARQYGNLSFSRIYGAGDFAPCFQPETAFTVFTRILQGTDISTGEIIDLSSFGSKGPANATYTNTAAYSPPSTCWIRAWNQSCSNDETAAMLDGNGIVVNGIYYLSSKHATPGLPTNTVPVGIPGHPISVLSDARTTLTGVYTATGTPKQSSGPAFTIKRPAHLDGQTLILISTLFSSIFGILVIL